MDARRFWAVVLLTLVVGGAEAKRWEFTRVGPPIVPDATEMRLAQLNSGRVILGYVRFVGTSGMQIWYAELDGSVWEHTLIDDTGSSYDTMDQVSIAAHLPTDSPALAYMRYGLPPSLDNEIVYTYRQNSIWHSAYQVTNGGTARPTLKFLPGGQAAIGAQYWDDWGMPTIGVFLPQGANWARTDYYSHLVLQNEPNTPAMALLATGTPVLAAAGDVGGTEWYNDLCVFDPVGYSPVDVSSGHCPVGFDAEVVVARNGKRLIAYRTPAGTPACSGQPVTRLAEGVNDWQIETSFSGQLPAYNVCYKLVALPESEPALVWYATDQPAVGTNVTYRSGSQWTTDNVDEWTFVYDTISLSNGRIALVALTADGMCLYIGNRECKGDMNCDGSVNLFDIDPLNEAFYGQALWETAHPACPWLNGDCNDDGMVDFFDIDLFVVRLGAVCPP